MARIDRQRRSTNIEDRRAQGPVIGGGRGSNLGAMILLQLLFSRAGRRFILPLIAIGIIAFVVFPKQTQAILGAILGGGPAAQVTPLDPATEARLRDETSAFLGSTEDVWRAIYTARGESYPEPTLVLYTGAVSSEACGFASAAVGPFYCPGDRRLYLDLGFFRDLEVELGATGDFAQAYVIAHEIGHHVQNLEGVLSSAEAQRGRAASEADANRVQVRVELMADCLAGVWAGEAERRSQIVLEPGDLEEAIGAAQAVGDDTLQRRARGAVAPDSFTHGSAAQRVRWLQSGFSARDPDACTEALTLPDARL
jgi:predicted metalloprotease